MPGQLTVSIKINNARDIHSRWLSVNGQLLRDLALRRWTKQLAGCLRMGLLTTNEHADLCMGMY